MSRPTDVLAVAALGVGLTAVPPLDPPVLIWNASASAPIGLSDVERPTQLLKRAGHEAGSLSPWLHPELKALGVPVVCLEPRQARAAMSAQRNKTDATDALGLTHLMRTGWCRLAYVKTEGPIG
jgi:transposase